MIQSVLLISVLLFVCTSTNCVSALPSGLLHPSLEPISDVESVNDSETVAAAAVANPEIISSALVRRLSGCPHLDLRLHCICNKNNLRIHLICNNVTDLGLLKSGLQEHNYFHSLWLLINGSNIPTLVQRTLEGIRVRGLHINHSNVSHISDNAFADMDDLEFLSLQNDALENVPVLALRRLLRLNTLGLADNYITSIPNAAFVGMPNLLYVSLTNNAISTIHKGSFGEQLTQLALSNNNITTLNGSIRNLPNLEWLLLTGNNLVSLENELVNLPSLSLLRLDDNQLETLHAWTFRGLVRLQALNLSNNALSNISKDAFNDLRMMTTLNLSNNRLVSTQGFLLPMRKLTKLDLSNNLLEKFRIKQVVNMLQPPNLSSHLNMSTSGANNNNYNGLSDVNTLATSLLSSDKQPVQYFPNLTTLILSGNRLISLDHELHHLVSLTHLYLDNNDLISVNDQFVGLSSLQVLNLSHNNIDMILTTTFETLFHLAELDLSYNRLRFIQGGIFDQLVNLQKLNLSDNRIDNVQDGLFSPMNSLLELDFMNNDIVNVHPMAFVHLHSLQVLNLGQNKLVTTSRYLSPLFKLEVLILADNSLNSLDGEDFASLISLKRLDVSRNRIMDVGAHLQLSLPDLQNLWLGNNRVTTLHTMLHRLPNLRELDLRHNELSRLVKGSFSHNPKLHILRIQGNPWMCDSDLADVLLQLEANSTQIDYRPWCINSVA